MKVKTSIKKRSEDCKIVRRKGRAEQLSTYDFIEKDGTINF